MKYPLIAKVGRFLFSIEIYFLMKTITNRYRIIFFLLTNKFDDVKCSEDYDDPIKISIISFELLFKMKKYYFFFNITKLIRFFLITTVKFLIATVYTATVNGK
jgi:hypothetical protein